MNEQVFQNKKKNHTNLYIIQMYILLDHVICLHHSILQYFNSILPLIELMTENCQSSVVVGLLCK